MPKRISYWFLLATIVALPWYVIRFSISGIPLTLLEVMVLATGAVWLVEELFWRDTLREFIASQQSLKRLVVQNWVLVLVVVAFIGSASVAVLVADDLRSALGIFKAYILEPILLFIVALNLLTSRKAWWGAAAALATAALSVIGLTFTQWLWQWPNFAPTELVQGRASAVYNTANAVGLFIGPVVIFSVISGIAWLNQSKRLLATGALLLFLAGLWSIVLSQSLGAMIALGGTLFASCGWWLLQQRRFDWGRFFSLFIALGLGVYVAGTVVFMLWFNHPPTVANPYTRPGFSTFTVRQCTWEGAVNALESSPIAGLGLAGFTGRYLENSTCDAEPLVYPHNFVLNFWSELGLVGLISTLLMTGYWLISTKSLLVDERFGWIGLALCLGLVYWLLHGLVDVPYFKNDLAMEWWLLLGLTISARRVFLED